MSRTSSSFTLRALPALLGAAMLELLLVGVVFGETLRRLDLDSIRGAVIRQVRFEMYWWGREDEFRRGASLILHVASDGRRFIARVDDVYRLPDGRSEVAFFEGEQGTENTWIVLSSRTPVTQGEEPFHGREWWTMLRTKPENPFFVRDSIVLPPENTPLINPTSPVKQRVEAKRRVKAAILNAVQQNLLRYARLAEQTLPAKVTLVLPDFNVEDPAAYVLVQEAGTVYEVELHDPGDPEDPRFKGEESLLARPFAGRPKNERWLATRIRRKGESHLVIPR